MREQSQEYKRDIVPRFTIKNREYSYYLIVTHLEKLQLSCAQTFVACEPIWRGIEESGILITSVGGFLLLECEEEVPLLRIELSAPLLIK